MARGLQAQPCGSPAHSVLRQHHGSQRRSSRHTSLDLRAGSQAWRDGGGRSCGLIDVCIHGAATGIVSGIMYCVCSAMPCCMMRFNPLRANLGPGTRCLAGTKRTVPGRQMQPHALSCPVRARPRCLVFTPQPRLSLVFKDRCARTQWRLSFASNIDVCSCPKCRRSFAANTAFLSHQIVAVARLHSVLSALFLHTLQPLRIPHPVMLPRHAQRRCSCYFACVLLSFPFLFPLVSTATYVVMHVIIPMNTFLCHLL
jgi:hypothetical protein